jgi:hypothetical protein
MITCTIRLQARYICFADVHDMNEDDEEDDASVIPLGKGSAELLPKREQLKVEKLVPTGVTVGEGGMTFNFTGGQ